MNYEDIKGIIDSWEGFNLSDVSGIIEFRQKLSALYYRLSEYKADEESYYIGAEAKRKQFFFESKLAYIDQGDSATKAETKAYVNSEGARIEEINHERKYKKAKDILNSLDHVLNAMSSAINQATNERKQSNYHT